MPLYMTVAFFLFNFISTLSVSLLAAAAAAATKKLLGQSLLILMCTWKAHFANVKGTPQKWNRRPSPSPPSLPKWNYLLVFIMLKVRSRALDYCMQAAWLYTATADLRCTNGRRSDKVARARPRKRKHDEFIWVYVCFSCVCVCVCAHRFGSTSLCVSLSRTAN